jgi:hypothetical protein
MGKIFGELIGGAVDSLVKWIVLPVVSSIPFLVSSGILLVAYGLVWLGFGAAMVSNPSALDQAWRSLVGMPLPVQGLAWLLLMPALAGLWVWGTGWPLAVRLAVIAGLAGWNLLVMAPRRASVREAAVSA